MKFRPCIDIHNGNVKQIVGGSLSDKNNYAVDNFVSEYDGAYYGKLYKSYGLTGGHIIILNPVGSEFYNADLEQAYSALSAFEGGLQIGGGINDENAAQFLEKGASHVIVTSFVFKNGVVNFYNLNRVVTDRWQKFTDIEMNSQTLEMFSKYCDEFLIHAVDTEGKAKGIEPQIAKIMGEYCTIPSTYAGGISSFEDLDNLKELGRGKIDFTIGSALDIFGGNMNFEKVAVYGK